MRLQQQQQAPVRQAAPQRQQARPRPQQAQEEGERSRQFSRTTQPPVKILRKYREDNPDGSITWGYENDDGKYNAGNLTSRGRSFKVPLHNKVPLLRQKL